MEEKQIYRAAGAIIAAKDTGRIMLNLRSEFTSRPKTWSFWGGMIEPTENITEGLSRELHEELGEIPSVIKVFPLDLFFSDDKKFNYYTLLIIVEKEFIPVLNRESDGYAWCNIGTWPKPLHEGAKKLLYNKNIKKNLIWALRNSDK